MPKREDEYRASEKEEKTRPLCPYCGSLKVYYNRRYGSWRCGRCEKSFPYVCYGPGKDFGKEARWFGKSTARGSDWSKMTTGEIGEELRQRRKSREAGKKEQASGKKLLGMWRRRARALRRCPLCKKKSLYWNQPASLYECLNVRCRKRYTAREAH